MFHFFKTNISHCHLTLMTEECLTLVVNVDYLFHKLTGGGEGNKMEMRNNQSI